MLNRKRRITILISFMLILSMLLTGCGMSELIDMANQGGGSVSWTNSEIIGAINSSTKTAYKDDFFTAVNKDWILEKSAAGEDAVQIFEAEKLVAERMVTLMTDPESTGLKDNTTVGMNAEEIAHAAELVSVFASAAGDAEKRNALGVEPLRPYIDAIRNIKTMEEMTAYILDFDGMNIVGAPLANVKVGTTRTNPEVNELIISPLDQTLLTLEDGTDYRFMGSEAIEKKEINSDIVRLVLEKLGMRRGEINGILRRAYALEYDLGTKPMSEAYVNMSDYDEKALRIMQMEDISAIFRDYPIKEIIKSYGYGDPQECSVYETDYHEALGKYYTKAHLENLKAYYIMHTVTICADILDLETKETVYELKALNEETDEDAAEAVPNENAEVSALLKEYVQKYIPAPLEMMYIAAYCTGEQKAEIYEMIDRIKPQLRKIILEEEWLSEESKTNAVEKLDLMTEKVLFPDDYYSYKPLKLSADQSLPDMLRSIRIFEKRKAAADIGMKFSEKRWDLGAMATTTINAYNDLDNNCIVILAGLLADDFTFDPAAEFEVNLARLGFLVGHELTHSFDSTGYMYDKHGKGIDYNDEVQLITREDRDYFTKKIYSLTTWYNALTPVPGESGYMAPVAGEAMADMGGMKCALYVAGETENFDYDLFFRSYAELWRKVNSRETEMAYAKSDEHPLAFLRTNVVVQQFDEFMETYDVKPGDGMYLAPEKRIMVW